MYMYTVYTHTYNCIEYLPELTFHDFKAAIIINNDVMPVFFKC